MLVAIFLPFFDPPVDTTTITPSAAKVGLLLMCPILPHNYWDSLVFSAAAAIAGHRVQVEGQPHFFSKLRSPTPALHADNG